MKPKITLKWETPTLPTSPIRYPEMVDTAKRINERTNGEVTVEVYGIDGVVPVSEIFQGVASGKLDIGFTVSGYGKSDGLLPRSQVAHLPIWPSGQAGCAFVKTVLDNYIRSDMEALGVTPIIYEINSCDDFGYFMAPTRAQLWFTKMCASLEDVKGAKIYSDTDTISSALKAIGMAPVFVPFAETCAALSNNLIDGTLMPNVLHLFNSSLADLMSCCLKVDYPACEDNFTIMNLKTYNSLPADIRNIIIEELKNWQMAPTMDRGPLIKRCWDFWNERVKAGKLKIIELTPDEKAWCQQQWEQTLVDEWIKRQIAAGFKDAKAYLEDLLKIRDNILASGIPQYTGSIY